MDYSQHFEVKKEAIMTVGNVLTCVPLQLLEGLLEHETLLNIYLREGPRMLQDKNIIFNVLSVIEHFGQMDKNFQRSGP